MLIQCNDSDVKVQFEPSQTWFEHTLNQRFVFRFEVRAELSY